MGETSEDDSSSAISTLIEILDSYSSAPDVAQAGASNSARVSADGFASADPAKQREAAAQLSEELLALRSIYTDEALHLLRISPSGESDSPSRVQSTSASAPGPTPADPHGWSPAARITLTLATEVDPPLDSCPTASSEPIPLRIAITLPAFYPHSSKPPQLQLLSRYVAGYSVDHTLFGEVLRAFYHRTEHEQEEVRLSAADGGECNTVLTSSGVHWRAGEVVLFEGIEWVKEKVAEWWSAKEQARRENANDRGGGDVAKTWDTETSGHENREALADARPSSPHRTEQNTFRGTIVTAPPLTDRKSVFVGHAARIQHPDEVPEVLSQILADRKVSRATHPAINAWTCTTSDGIVHRDSDDDGESAAGGRLSHLLALLDLHDVIVVVTRWYGGVHLGPDRFKLINRAARDALELAGLVDGPLNPRAATAEGSGSRGGKGMGKRV